MYKWTKPHPPKVPIERCIWNPDYIGYRRESGCKTMGFKYKERVEFPQGERSVWKKHKKLEMKTERT